MNYNSVHTVLVCQATGHAFNSINYITNQKTTRASIVFPFYGDMPMIYDSSSLR